MNEDFLRVEVHIWLRGHEESKEPRMLPKIVFAWIIYIQLWVACLLEEPYLPFCYWRKNLLILRLFFTRCSKLFVKNVMKKLEPFCLSLLLVFIVRYKS